ncbi:PREDICTED: probable endonuclease lcl3 [Amphimedon queenslandica]|uniref:TNase-like domain-containing protein n=1 Tax=Amphimedon queenslandica TaxID=400682 RepID=A0A1X7VPS7_AMPQE|nr:PREDICTED: probable endonuclease lcl3 [Amphimedon queenslandica]|eukprot:XP_011409655.1 PREDICTED: probable endonuclease lcl3 [Amphimedon queenslandica]
MDVMDDWIDKNIRLVRLLPWFVGGFGVYLIARNTHMFSHFQSAASIPLNLVRTNHRLTGRVVNFSGDSLGVWHIPLGHWVLRRKLHPPSNENLLRVSFAGISHNDLTKTGKWIEENLYNEKIRFILLDGNEEQVECIVFKANKFPFFNTASINESLLTNGLATIRDVPCFHGNTRHHTSFVSRLVKSEKAAKKRGRGMWEGSEHEKWRWKIWRGVKKFFSYFKRK